MPGRRLKSLGLLGAGLALSAALASCAGRGSAATANSSTTAPTQPSTSTSSSTSTTTVVRLSLPVTVLEIGDSLGEDLGFGLAYELANDRRVHLFPDAVGDTGLANEPYYNWFNHLRSDLAATHPQVVVIFLGANDTQGFSTGSSVVSFPSSAWDRAYSRRVGQLMTEATSAGAKVIWVGMPVMKGASDSLLASNLSTMNSIYETQAAKHPGVTFMSSMSIFATPSGQFTATSPGPNGTTYDLRAPDGVHLANDGEDLLAAAVIREMDRLYGLHLKPVPPPVP